MVVTAKVSFILIMERQKYLHYYEKKRMVSLIPKEKNREHITVGVRKREPYTSTS